MVTSPNNAISGNGKNAISVTYTVMLPPIRKNGISPYLMIKVQFSNVFLDHFLPTVSTTIKLTIPMIKGRRMDNICNLIALSKQPAKRKNV